MDWGSLGINILKILFAIILIIIIAGSALFGYISLKAEARKWGVGMFMILIVCVFAFYWLLAITFGIPFPL